MLYECGGLLKIRTSLAQKSTRHDEESAEKKRMNETPAPPSPAASS